MRWLECKSEMRVYGNQVVSVWQRVSEEEREKDCNRREGKREMVTKGGEREKGGREAVKKKKEWEGEREREREMGGKVRKVRKRESEGRERRQTCYIFSLFHLLL